tara:strand:- start:9624 stop:10976 length:1353 start_codon:yes stop_codon:yes gene_type:complete
MLNKLNILTINNTLTLLAAIIPLSFIAGNLVLNLNIIILILVALIIYRGKIFKIEYDFLDKLIITFFAYIISISLINFFSNLSENNNDLNVMILKKSFFYLRFLLLYFVIRYLLRENKINFKIIFFSSSICCLFVSLDLIYQYIFGFDIFGIEYVDRRRMSGPFGDELIAGSYIQRFSLFLIFSIPLLERFKSKKIFFLVLSFVIFLLLFSVILSGNRMPLILLMFTLFLIFISEKSLRKFFLLFIFISSILILSVYNFNQSYQRHLDRYYDRVTEFIILISDIYSKDKEIKKRYDSRRYVIEVDGKKIGMPNVYVKEFQAGYETWLLNKFVGDGVKSFKKNCQKTNVINCGPHPHNYYLETLADLGLVGLILLLLISFISIYRSLLKKFSSLDKRFGYIITPFIFLFFVEIFPIRTTGSFFSTGNATYFFLILSILIALSKKEFKIKNL